MTKIILNFLEELRENNQKMWFEEHREQYEFAKSELIDVLSQVITRLGQIDQTVVGLDPAKCTFRQYRDLRFSKNKAPYKITMSGYIALGGKNSENAGYYLHLEPGKSFVGGGLYSPLPDVLRAVRNEIYYNVQDFKKIIHNPHFFQTFGPLANEKLVKAPKGFPADFADIELLKYKHYIVSREFSPETMDNEQLTRFVSESFITMVPFIRFINLGVKNME